MKPQKPPARLTIELEHDGRWVPIGELTALPSMIGYGGTHEEALAAVEEIGREMMADQLGKDAGKAPASVQIPAVAGPDRITST